VCTSEIDRAWRDTGIRQYADTYGIDLVENPRFATVAQTAGHHFLGVQAAKTGAPAILGAP
jgi:hypothetical protein